MLICTLKKIKTIHSHNEQALAQTDLACAEKKPQTKTHPETEKVLTMIP